MDRAPVSHQPQHAVYSPEGTAPTASAPRYRTVIGAVSLIVAPAVMSVGDLMHPPESWDSAAQVAIVVQAPGRWYLAHLLLVVGMLLFVPGVLTLTDVAGSRKPRMGYAARVLMLVGVAALSAVITFEMLLGRFVASGADQTSAVSLLMTFMSGPVFAALVPGLLAFFVGSGLAVGAIAPVAGPMRWPALLYALGAALIFGEIASAIVLLSQIGNVLIWVAGIGFARALLRSR